MIKITKLRLWNLDNFLWWFLFLCPGYCQRIISHAEKAAQFQVEENMLNLIITDIVKLATVVECDPKAPFSVATTVRV